MWISDTHLNMKEKENKILYNPQHMEKSSNTILIVGKSTKSLFWLSQYEFV